MPGSTKTDFKIYDEQFFTGATETAMQNTAAFNAASNNGIVLVPNRLVGDFNRESFIKEIADLVTYRDTTSVSPATVIPITGDETVGVKVNRKIGPAGCTLDAWKKMGADQEVASFLLGQQWAAGVLKDQLNTAIQAAVAAAQAGAMVSDHSADGKITPVFLKDLMALYGDNLAGIAAFVMHSASYYDLLGNEMQGSLINVAGVALNTGIPATLGKPVVITDCPALAVAGTPESAPGAGDGTPDAYRVLGLSANGLGVIDSEERTIMSNVEMGLENLVLMYQGEHAYNVTVKGYAYASAVANPQDPMLAAPSSWRLSASDRKSSGVAMLVTA